MKHRPEEVPTEKSWLAVVMVPFAPSVDPSAPPSYRAKLQGRRSDGMVFEVGINIDKARWALIPSSEAALRAMSGMLTGALQQLDSYRNCACMVGLRCRAHEKVEQSLIQ